ncbi:hypothetical protein QBC43DRAFT_348858 [Cladorrhinum sp. PSN259]|nr:hypothetical protein QBC43DRAFT_348858 [Cladorrhinum sp. PSN259]
MHLFPELLVVLFIGQTLAAPAVTGLPYSKTKALREVGCVCINNGLDCDWACDRGLDCVPSMDGLYDSPHLNAQNPSNSKFGHYPECCWPEISGAGKCSTEDQAECALTAVVNSRHAHSLKFGNFPECCWSNSGSEPCSPENQPACIPWTDSVDPHNFKFGEFPVCCWSPEAAGGECNPEAQSICSEIVPHDQVESAGDPADDRAQLEPRQASPTATITIVRPVDTTLATTTITLTKNSEVSVAPSAVIAIPSTVTVPQVVLVSPTATPIPIGNFTVSTGNFTVFLNATAPSSSVFFTAPPSQVSLTIEVTFTPIILSTITASPAPIILSTVTLNPGPATATVDGQPFGTVSTIPFQIPGSPVTVAPNPAVGPSFSTITLPSIPATTITITLPTARTVTMNNGLTVNSVFSTAIITPATSTITLPTVTVTLNNTPITAPASNSPVTITWSPILPTSPVPVTVTLTPSMIPLAASTITLFPISSISTTLLQAPPLASIPFGTASTFWVPAPTSPAMSGQGRTITLLQTVPYFTAGANGAGSQTAGYETVTSLVVIPDGIQTGGAITQSPWAWGQGTDTVLPVLTDSWTEPASSVPVVQGIVTTVTVDALQGLTKTVYVTVTGLQVDVGPTQPEFSWTHVSEDFRSYYTCSATVFTLVVFFCSYFLDPHLQIWHRRTWLWNRMI